MENLKYAINRLIEAIEKIEQRFKDNKDSLSNYYARNYLHYVKPTPYSEPVPFALEEYDEVFEQDIQYLDAQIRFLKSISQISFHFDNKMAAQMSELTEKCILEMNGLFLNGFHDDMLFLLCQHRDYSIAYQSIMILSQFSSIAQNIVIIGGNGSGKTSLANIMKGDDRKIMSVIPAQKSLFFTLNDTNMLTTRLRDLEIILLDNNINRSKEGNDYGYYSYQNNQFTKLIIAMKEQHFQYLNRCYEDGITPEQDKSIFGQLNEIFSVLFPEITLSFREAPAEFFSCYKNGQQYHVNALSEGEKAVIYYALSILMAKENSLIVVDEPETYLNPSLANTLWDVLIDYRDDCQFIFITHSINFILGRNDVRIAWIKNFVYPDCFSFEFVDDSFALPKILLTEVLGSRKPVLFCEGDDKSSMDYKVYQGIFKNQYTVIPVGGHRTVIQFVKVINASEWIGIDSQGIIDGDNYSAERIQSLHEKKIHVLPFNEIEMLILSDEVIHSVMKTIFPDNYQERIEGYKNKFWEVVEQNKEEILLNYAREIANEYIQGHSVDSFDSLEAIKNSLSEISSFNLDFCYEERKKELDEIIANRDYDKMLIYCNLKKKISKEIANIALDREYELKAVQHIANHSELKELLKHKYFSEL